LYTISSTKKYKLLRGEPKKPEMTKLSDTHFVFPPNTKGTVWYGLNVKGRVYYRIKNGSLNGWWIRIGYLPWQWGSIDKIGELSGKGSLPIPSGPRAELRMQNNTTKCIEVFITDNVSVARSPDEINECCTYPDEKQTCYSHNVQGVTHDQSNWFISNPTQLWAFPYNADLSKKKPKPFIFAHINGWPQFKGYRFKDLSYYEMESEPPTSRLRRLVFIALCHHADPKTIISVHRAPQFGANKNNYDPLGHVVTEHEQLAWVAVNPIDGLLYTSGTIKGQENKFIYVYSFSFTGGFHIDFVRNINVRDERGIPLYISWVQGGCFSDDGHLYISSGSYKGHVENSGINGIDLRTGRRFLHFRPDYEPGWPKYHEIEGITYWDLGTKSSHIPNMGGQIHLLVLDNDCEPWRDNGTGSGAGCANPDDVIFRHIYLR
jgi:hypothetical protein